MSTPAGKKPSYITSITLAYIFRDSAASQMQGLLSNMFLCFSTKAEAVAAYNTASRDGLLTMI